MTKITILSSFFSVQKCTFFSLQIDIIFHKVLCNSFLFNHWLPLFHLSGPLSQVHMLYSNVFIWCQNILYSWFAHTGFQPRSMCSIWLDHLSLPWLWCWPLEDVRSLSYSMSNFLNVSGSSLLCCSVILPISCKQKFCLRSVFKLIIWNSDSF